MNGLTQTQLEALHAALEQRRHMLLDQVALATAGPAVEEVETSPADSASNRTMNQLQQETAGHLLTQLRAIKHALAKFDDDSYGSCENCGNDIGYSRLHARPEATLCIACQTRSEQRQR
ncbi:TraR/DksA family transcriptional regulator [Duganella sp. FT92W]|uniref:TraR/DksA family transcriptional regulator n=1 Tax=Pseudoduganella rivuli TaxID=2666085 RepID=A0A7X2IMK1_9BURK|nr:TraR/DksA family transcriptional regulator [Pseudoduganella rivuli]MRV72218.1 TraR/DksA family transcriptional regulator [Pseudoduganella rivuli]